jgi:hypothetical protein
MTQSQKTSPPAVQQADTQLIDPDVAQRARERRYQRAIAGWFASRMRTRAHQRRHPPDDEPAQG